MDYLLTTPEDEVAAGREQDDEVARQVGEEGQRGEGEEQEGEHHPVPSDAGDSDDRGPHGDSHVPRVFELGDFTPEEEFEIMYGNKEQREAMFREVEMQEEQSRQREQEEGAEDVEMEGEDLPEASTTPTSLEEPSFFNNMLDELRDGVEPHARIVIEAAMEASNLALNTNGDDLEVMMRIVRDTAMEAFDDNGTPRHRLRIWRRRFRARLEGCGIWQRSLTRAEVRERSRSRTSRATRTTTRRSATEEPESEEEEGETESQQYQRYMQSGIDEVSEPELWQQLHH